ncbi:MAG: signal recognition particle protein [Oligoflexia bacterium]|nr:signal recognition particle protein [Oligoflexia bacterium]
MFEQLSAKILSPIKKLKGQGKITISNIEAALRDIRLALLEADVNYKVAKLFIESITKKAIGHEVIGDLRPDQQLIKIVHDELVHLMGSLNQELDFSGSPPTVIMLCGLQGAGKTTTAAKLSALIQKKYNKTSLLVSVDVYRPAAIEQLKTLCTQNKLSFFESQTLQKPDKIAQLALENAVKNNFDVLIVDTAGRLQIDEDLMTELEKLKGVLKPKEILLVADSMTGQDAVNIAQGFNEKLKITGVILTKLDGDTRGGAALSIKAVTGAPIKFSGMSEKISGLEVFHPDRIASRLLDKGDVLSLVEKAQEVFEADKAHELEKKLRKNQFNLEDFKNQLKQFKKLGSFESVLKMLPGMGQVKEQLKNMTPPDEEIKKIEAIINSMTPQERQNHGILNGSRRARIAKGSGTQVSDINRFIKQFEQTSKLMKLFTKSGRLPF